MASEVGLVSLIHLQNLVQYSQLNRVEHSSSDSADSAWMQRNNDKKQVPKNDDDSWEVRAFEEDMTGNMMGCTWPPRFYTCTYCRREFRSAQALGGHMNVHRRDRAKLNEVSPIPPSTVAKSTHPSAFFVPGQEFVANGLCLLYSLPNPNNGFFMTPRQINASTDSPSPLLSKSVGFPLICNYSSNTEPSASTNSNDNNESVKESSPMEDIDLELRLGCRSPPPQEGR